MKTDEGRYLPDFLNLSTSVESVGRDGDFGDCVRQLLVRDLAEAYLRENYPRLCRDDTFEDLLAKLESKIERIEGMNLSRSTTVGLMCTVFYELFEDFVYVDDAQARRVTRLMRDSVTYQNIMYDGDDDDEDKKLLDDAYPEILDDDEDEEDEDDDEVDEDWVPEPVSVFVARHIENTDEEIVRVRDILGARDGEHDVNYTESFEEFMEAPFTFSA